MQNLLWIIQPCYINKHDVCLDQMSFKCKISEKYSNLLFLWAKSQILDYVYPNEEKIDCHHLLGMYLSCLESYV